MPIFETEQMRLNVIYALCLFFKLHISSNIDLILSLTGGRVLKHNQLDEVLLGFIGK